MSSKVICNINPPGDGDGEILLEFEPLKRVITVESYPRPRETHYLYFPYTYFLISYQRYEGKIFLRNYLRVFFSPQPLRSLDDMTYNLPLWNIHEGVCCIGEDLWVANETGEYGSLDDLTKHVVEFFWSSTFNNDVNKVDNDELASWKHLTLTNELVGMKELLYPIRALRHFLPQNRGVFLNV